jgi:hypothetical protein
MARFILHHHHAPGECRAANAALKKSAMPRHHPGPGFCRLAGHEMWWSLDATSEEDALRHLPPYVAERTDAIRVGVPELT